MQYPTDTLPALPAEFSAYVEELEKAVDGAGEEIEALRESLANLEETVNKKDGDEDEKDEKSEGDDDEDEDDEDEDTEKAVLKSLAPEARAVVEKALSDAETARAEVAKERGIRLDAEYVEKAKRWDNLGLNSKEVGPMLRGLEDTDPELAKEFTRVLDGAQTAVQTADVFTEIGKTAANAEDSAYGQIEAIAKAKLADGKAESYADAIAAAAEENPTLYRQHQTEMRG